MEKIIYGVNLVLLLLLILFQYHSVSDKTIIISSLGVGTPIVLNLLLGFFAQMDKNKIYKHYYYSVLIHIIGAMILLSI